MNTNTALAVQCPSCLADVNVKCTAVKLVEQADGTLVRQGTPTAAHALRKRAAAARAEA